MGMHARQVRDRRAVCTVSPLVGDTSEFQELDCENGHPKQEESKTHETNSVSRQVIGWGTAGLVQKSNCQTDEEAAYNSIKHVHLAKKSSNKIQIYISVVKLTEM